MLDLKRIRADVTARLEMYTTTWPALEQPPAHLVLKLGEPVAYLKRALAKLDAGSYGICDDCNEPIGAKRLSVVIGACRCLECQQAHDAKPPLCPAA